jgi:hypothetical protein
MEPARAASYGNAVDADEAPADGTWGGDDDAEAPALGGDDAAGFGSAMERGIAARNADTKPSRAHSKPQLKHVRATAIEFGNYSVTNREFELI